MKKYRIIWNFLIVVFSIDGVVLNYLEPNVSKNTIIFFTTQSN